MGTHLKNLFKDILCVLAIDLLFAGLALGQTSGGFPSRPLFQSVRVNGSVTDTSETSSGNVTGANLVSTGVVNIQGQTGSQIQLTPVLGTPQSSYQFFTDNNLYVDAPFSGTPAGGNTYFRNGSAGHVSEQITAGGAVVISPPSTVSTALAIGQFSATWVSTMTGANVGSSRGLLITDGNNAADIPFDVTNEAASANFFYILGDGSIVAGNTATGEGAGTLNAQVALYQQNNRVPLFAYGQVGGTSGGCTIGSPPAHPNLTGCTRSSAGVYQVTLSGFATNYPVCIVQPDIITSGIKGQSDPTSLTNQQVTITVGAVGTDAAFFMQCMGT